MHVGTRQSVDILVYVTFYVYNFRILHIFD